MPILNTITNKLLGTTTQVRVKRYGDGTISYQEVTAGKGEKRTQAGATDEKWIRDFVKALATVA
jgi:hypothetical protein